MKIKENKMDSMGSLFEFVVFIFLCMMLYVTVLKTIYDPEVNKLNRYGRIVLICGISVVVVSYLLYLLPKYIDMSQFVF